MHKLGVAKRAIEAFSHLISGKVDDGLGPTSTSKKGSSAAIESIETLVDYMEGILAVSLIEIFQEQSLEKLFLLLQRRRVMNLLVS